MLLAVFVLADLSEWTTRPFTLPFEPTIRSGKSCSSTSVCNLLVAFQVNGATYVAPDGSVKYTTYGNTMLYRGENGSGTTPNFKLPKYTFRGQVLDEDGHPIAGAALRIGNDLVFSNSEGEFFLRKKKNRPCRVDVELGQFIVPGIFAVVSSPTVVAPSERGSENPITITLRRITSH